MVLSCKHLTGSAAPSSAEGWELAPPACRCSPGLHSRIETLEAMLHSKAHAEELEQCLGRMAEIESQLSRNMETNQVQWHESRNLQEEAAAHISVLQVCVCSHCVGACALADRTWSVKGEPGSPSPLARSRTCSSYTPPRLTAYRA